MNVDVATPIVRLRCGGWELAARMRERRLCASKPLGSVERCCDSVRRRRRQAWHGPWSHGASGRPAPQVPAPRAAGVAQQRQARVVRRRGGGGRASGLQSLVRGLCGPEWEFVQFSLRIVLRHT